jgi:hypothetical protein
MARRRSPAASRVVVDSRELIEDDALSHASTS